MSSWARAEVPDPRACVCVCVMCVLVVPGKGWTEKERKQTVILD